MDAMIADYQTYNLSDNTLRQESLAAMVDLEDLMEKVNMIPGIDVIVQDPLDGNGVDIVVRKEN